MQKPTWLIDFLAACNWTILTWYINPGEWIESAIDWVLDRINDVLGVIESAINAGGALWDRVTGFWHDLTEYVDNLVDRIWDEIESIPDTIDRWWAGTQRWVRDRIDAMGDWLTDRIEDVRDAFQWLGNEWDNFRYHILPDLLPSWDIQGLIDSAFNAWSDLFNFWGELGSTVMEFFTNPFEWVVEKFADWFLGEEGESDTGRET